MTLREPEQLGGTALADLDEGLQEALDAVGVAVWKLLSDEPVLFVEACEEGCRIHPADASEVVQVAVGQFSAANVAHARAHVADRREPRLACMPRVTPQLTLAALAIEAEGLAKPALSLLAQHAVVKVVCGGAPS